MRRHPAKSLGRRLSWWLALQSFGVLLTVNVAVYLATSLNLSARQHERLRQEYEQVVHLLSDVESDSVLTTLKHKLDDYFVGHRDTTLAVTRVDGTKVYESAIPTKEWVNEIRFVVPYASSRGDKLVATLTLDKRDDIHLLHRLALTLMASAFSGALIVSAGGFVLVKLGLRPVQQLVEQTSQLAADNLSRPLDGSAQPEELQPLIAQFNALLSRLALSYQQLEGFNADVAHELCTPLATLTSSVELAMRKPRAATEMQDLLGSNLEELHRMTSIVQDMLFLSQAARGSIARRVQTSSLAALVSTVAAYHLAALDEAGLRLEVVGDAAGEFDLPLLRRAVSNLISNATRYALGGSTIQVEIRKSSPGQIRLAVANRGMTIEPEHLPRLFDRFYRSDYSRSHADQNHGLGLSIVAAITRMHGGEPFAESANGTTTIGMTLNAFSRHIPITFDRSSLPNRPLSQHSCGSCPGRFRAWPRSWPRSAACPEQRTSTEARRAVPAAPMLDRRCTQN